MEKINDTCDRVTLLTVVTVALVTSADTVQGGDTADNGDKVVMVVAVVTDW